MSSLATTAVRAALGAVMRRRVPVSPTIARMQYISRLNPLQYVELNVIGNLSVQNAFGRIADDVSGKPYRPHLWHIDIKIERGQRIGDIAGNNAYNIPQDSRDIRVNIGDGLNRHDFNQIFISFFPVLSSGCLKYDLLKSLEDAARHMSEINSVEIASLVKNLKGYDSQIDCRTGRPAMFP